MPTTSEGVVGTPPPSEIGEGAFGQVFEARLDTDFGSFACAVKLLNPSAFANHQTAAARFKREIAALQKLQHRSIVSYHDAGLGLEGRPYLVMPLIHGRNLYAATEGKRAPYVMRLMREVISGIAYAHSRDVLHRDIKPSNILVRESDEQPMILDFGCAFIRDELGDLTLSAQGSAGYIPPEVISNPQHRAATHDIYSLAVTLYQIIARARPNLGEYASLTSIDPRLESVDRLIRRGVAKEAERFGTAVEMLSALDNALNEVDGGAKSPTIVPGSPVFHHDFGEGQVRNVDGDKVTVTFAEGITRVVMRRVLLTR